MMASIDLSSMLKCALLRHGLRQDPPLEDEARKGFMDPTVSYISSVLLDDDGDDEDHDQLARSGKYCQILSELTAIVAPRPLDSPKNSDSDGGLEYLLVRCAQAVAAGDSSRAFALVSDIKGALWRSSGGCLYRTISFFVDALTARLEGFGAQVYAAMAKEVTRRQYLSVRLLNLPCLKLSQRFANEHILELARGARRVHIVDYGIQYGFQWPYLIKALSQRSGGPPELKITGVDCPHVVNLAETGRKLVEFAGSCGVPFEFMAVASENWEKERIIRCKNEVLVVNSVLRLRHLRDHGTVAVDNPREVFLGKICGLRPDLFLQAEISADMSSPLFLQRFKNALEFYKQKMEYFEAVAEGKPEEHGFIQKVAARDIMNIVACEGLDRVERAASYRVWDARAKRAGFEGVAVAEEIYDKVRSACGKFRNPDFGFARDGNWMLLGWKDTVLYAMSAWRPKRVLQVAGMFQVL
ncbi:scarecrow-like protein 31 [Selaginella moellendorffii]|nr:scarecrow-like protein 31 [Selaginella moellendorffii]|eukprot:XP_002977216.2 scarecrow-like protein 31 [Selaginella moellendorffii]